MQSLSKTVFVLLLAASIFLLSGCSGVLSKRIPSDVSTAEGVSYLQEKEKLDAVSKENDLRYERTRQNASSSVATTNALQGGNFKAAFKDILIVGDSLVQALVEYHLLDETQAIGEVGAGTDELEQLTGTIVSANPKVLVLHYGENHLDKRERTPYFIRNYKACIETLQKRLPSTKIYVDSIFPVQEKARKTEPYAVNIDYYNSLMAEMAKELNVTFLDYTPLWSSFTTDYYDHDGIHPKYAFYKEQYLPHIYSEVYGK